MQAVILAAGKGTRLLPVTEHIPKALIKVNGTPIIVRILNQLIDVGVTAVLIVVHHFGDLIKNKLGNEYQGIKIKYAEQKKLNGDADALRYAERFVTDDKFLLIYCDSFFKDGHLKKLITHTTDGTLSVCKVSDARRFGVVLHENGIIKQIIEKSPNPPSNLANTSIHFLPKKIFGACNQLKSENGKEIRVVEAIQLLITQGLIFDFEELDTWFDIGTKEDLSFAEASGDEK
ncbi:hypothetical protein COV18_06150 [Candidatus Woesearchaeota archaeon CG10_big_fil_rev_8_21_14_0_10_37_12]|nr:MAG: hypothetical protein COV18_06150 [Candidatus Woesearchaeota archaeon CG10_big_fil_rev_8_21_14_0_10_37_12]